MLSRAIPKDSRVVEDWDTRNTSKVMFTRKYKYGQQKTMKPALTD